MQRRRNIGIENPGGNDGEGIRQRAAKKKELSVMTSLMAAGDNRERKLGSNQHEKSEKRKKQ